MSRRFRDKVTKALEAHVARLQASIATVAHQERPEYLDRLSVLRNQIFVLDHMYLSVFTTCSWVLRLAITIGLLVAIHPALALLALFALRTVATSAWRPGVERSAEERGAPSSRLAQHLFLTATTAAAGKEVRVIGLGPRLVRDRRAAWERWYGPVSAARSSSAGWHALAWSVFGAGYVGAVVFVAYRAGATPGDVLLVLAAGGRLSAYVGATVGVIGFLRGIWLDGSRRLAWLEDYAASVVAAAELGAPARLVQGSASRASPSPIPAPSASCSRTSTSICRRAPWWRSSARTARARPPWSSSSPNSTSRRRDAFSSTASRSRRIRPESWRARLAGAFQDFFRFELFARETVGLGDVPRLDDEPAVAAAAERAGADDVVSRLPAGFATQLGRAWPGGVEVSFGQWQKLALARGFMREQPLVLVLDEPTAVLDAETEHALFERYATAVRLAARSTGGESAGTITILVSHRFSTVRMADLIVVLDGSRVVQLGPHHALMAQAGPYAELYETQAAGYR